ncbi:MAG: hypothetical protein WA139_04435 [Candidatus Aenigmatarchaeota archaeon]
MEWRSSFEEQREEFSAMPLEHLKERMLEMIYWSGAGLVKTGKFDLSKGGNSSVYFDMRPALFNGDFGNYAGYLGSLILDELDRKEGCEHYPAGIYSGGVPLALGIMSYSGREALGINVKPDRGEQEIDGVFHKGRNYVIVDDVGTSGGSILEAAKKVRKEGGIVTQAIALLDRQKGAKENLEKEGIGFSSFFTSREILNGWNKLYLWRPPNTGELKVPVPKEKIPRIMGEEQVTFYRDYVKSFLV